jgi:threonine dehydrogenase-like Zn-dependent dehydrogenase
MDHELRCPNAEKGPRCIGRGCPVHMGFATDGVFADYVEVPATNVVRIAPKYVEMASKATQGLPCAAVFAFCEPILCTLTAYVLMEEESRRLLERGVQPGRAIVLGAGPMGFLWALVLVNKGWSVWLAEPIVSRARIVRACLDNRVDLLDSNALDASFELAVVTAPRASAIQRAEQLVKERGTVYLFAGLVKEDREAMDPDHLLRYERLHRVGKGTRTTTNVKGRDKELLYVGSSGYRDALALTSVSFVANHAATLDRSVSGLIHGWTASRIEARLPGGIDVDAKDGVPAIVRLLHGLDVRQGHLKILILGSELD